MKPFLISLCLCTVIFFIPAFGQKEANNWIFGYGEGFDFSNGYPTYLLGNALLSSDCSVISDKNGNLLFYSDGISVFNKNNQIMPNGDLAFLGALMFSIIIPKPDSDSLYYLFISDHALNNNTKGLRYCLIDMSLDGGKGAVVLKELSLSPQVWLKLAAVKHKNGKDVWLVSHELNTNAFYAYKITSSGISTPVISNAGYIYTNENSGSEFKFSPNGKKLAIAFYDGIQKSTLDVFDFDPATGEISNPIFLGDPYFGCSALEFSPDSRRLYFTTYYEKANGAPTKIFQVDLSSNDPFMTQNSAIWINYCPRIYSTIGDLQLSLDGKIYVSRGRKFYGTIHEPNESGTASFYEDSVKALNISGGSVWPNFISSYFQPKFTYTHTCVTDSTTFTIIDTSGVATVGWDFGDPGSGTFNISTDFTPKHKFSSNGDFNVKITFTFKDGSSTFYYYNVYIKDHLSPIDLGKDSLLCKGQSLELNPCYQGVSYLWSDGSGNPYYTATSADTVWLEISNACNAVRDTIILKFQEPPPVNLGKDTTLCYDIFPNFFLNATTSGATYKWKDGSTSPTLQVQNAQTYWVDVTVGVCTVRDSIQFYATSPAPVLHLGNDTLLCEKDSIQLNAFNSGATYLWQDGSTSPSYEVSKPDTISTTVTIGACIRKDTIVVTYKPLPVLSLGNDTIVCSGTQVLLNVFAPDYTYNWKDGSSLSSYSVTSKDTVWVEATLNGCHKRDSVFVNFIKAPVVHFGNDTTLCTGAQLLLSVLSEQSSYLWNNGSTDASRSIALPEKVWVQAQNKCGSATDTLLVSFLSSPILSIGNDTTLCFHDTLSLSIPSGYNYKWQDGSSNTTYSITTAGAYHVTATNQCGSFTATKNITNISCCNPYIPNLLTANNDGLNEVLFITCIEDGQWKLEIFNRWGEKVFQSADYHNEFNGQQLQEGIYYYALSKKGKASYKGWLQIVK